MTESWYIQERYQVLPKLQTAVQYDVVDLDEYDKKANVTVLLGYPRHLAFGMAWMFKVRWYVSTFWMLIAEYHRINSTTLLFQLGNPNRPYAGKV